VAREPPPPGSIIQYPYVWASRGDAGETEGRKSRPACLALRLRDSEKDIHHLVLSIFLMGNNIADFDANARAIGELGAAINASVQRVIETQATALAGMAAKTELLLLIGPDDELATSIANDLTRCRSVGIA
jgi:hypothetical protein